MSMRALTSVLSPAVVLLLIAAPLLAVTPAPLLGSADATIVVGKIQTVDFSPGFGLDCKHQITITISDESVLCAVNPPASSKGTNFKFEGKKPGLVNVVVEYQASQSNCSGFASVRRNILVTADLKAVEKDFKLSVNDTRKLIKQKIKTALKIYNREMNQIVKDFKAGQYDSVRDASNAMNGLEFGLGMWLFSNINKCLSDLSTEARLLLVDNAITELLPTMQLGNCESQYDDARQEGYSGFEGLARKMEARRAKSVKQLQKAEDELSVTDVNVWRVQPIGDFLGTVPGPDAGEGPTGSTIRAELHNGYSWNERDELGVTVNVGYHASVLGDPSQDEVQIDIAGPNGYSQQFTEPLEELATILAGQDLDDKLSQEQAGGLDLDIVQLATIGIELSPATTGGQEGGPALVPGSYRIEVRYPGDSAPSDTQYITIP